MEKCEEVTIRRDRSKSGRGHTWEEELKKHGQMEKKIQSTRKEKKKREEETGGIEEEEENGRRERGGRVEKSEE